MCHKAKKAETVHQGTTNEDRGDSLPPRIASRQQNTEHGVLVFDAVSFSFFDACAMRDTSRHRVPCEKI
jgi:hypothetical protein